MKFTSESFKLYVNKEYIKNPWMWQFATIKINTKNDNFTWLYYSHLNPLTKENNLVVNISSNPE